MKKDLTSSSAFNRLFDETISRISFFFEGKKLSEEEVLSKLYSPDRNERKKAQVSLTLGLKPHQPLLAYIYNQIKKDWKNLVIRLKKKIRKIKQKILKKTITDLL